MSLDGDKPRTKLRENQHYTLPARYAFVRTTGSQAKRACRTATRIGYELPFGGLVQVVQQNRNCVFSKRSQLGIKYLNFNGVSVLSPAGSAGYQLVAIATARNWNYRAQATTAVHNVRRMLAAGD